MPKPAKLYTAPAHAGPPVTIAQIAALAGCSYVNAFERVQAGKPVGGHVWARTGESQWTPVEAGTPERKQKPWHQARKAKPAPAPAAPPSPEPRAPWRYGTDPEAYDVLAINERRIQSADVPSGVQL